MKYAMMMLVFLGTSGGLLAADHEALVHDEPVAAHQDDGQTKVHDEHDAHHGDPAWWLVSFLLLICVGGAWLASRHFYVKTNGDYQPALTALQIFSAYLLTGTVLAQFWVHGNTNVYHATMHADLCTLAMHGSTYHINFHFLINDVFMAVFFGIAAKELSEAIFKPDGALRGVNGLLPGLACLGGVFGPLVVYKLLCSPEMSNAWAVPCATDIAFAWLGARAVWGNRHPAVIFLLALAIGDDFIGMGLIAGFYPQHEFHWVSLAYLGGGVALSFAFHRLAHRWQFFQQWWIYVLVAGPLCWLGLLLAGLHAALALVFVVPFMPMEGRDGGIFSPGETSRHHDTINNFEHRAKPVVDVGLFFFGLANAGVAWLGQSAWSQDSWAVFLGLGIGKTVGITLFTLVGVLVFRLSMPQSKETGERMRWPDVPVLGLLGAMGFTVALFVADAAGGAASLKLGALASFAYLLLAVAIGKLVCRRATS